MSNANIVIVGGTIAAGKSTLVENLAKSTGWQPVQELREGDALQEIILNKLYEGERIHLATVQYYFISNRYKQYEEVHNGLITSILDRGIWEDWFFAKLLMAKEPLEYEHYKVLWSETIEKLVNTYGLPKAYIYVWVDWDTFKERIFSRNRESEILNFNANEQYFKNLLHEYNTNFVKLLKEWNIEPIVIDSVELSKEETLEFALKELKRVKAL